MNPFDNTEVDSYSDNYSSPAGEYLITSYSNLSPTDDVNDDHANNMENCISPQIVL